MAKVKFNEPVKINGFDFSENEVVAFADAKASAFFIAAGWAGAAANDDADRSISKGSIVIDPNTVWGTGPKRGQRVV